MPGDARGSADTALIVKADAPPRERAAAGTDVRGGARRAFDGLPVTVRTLRRSEPYAAPLGTVRAAPQRPGMRERVVLELESGHTGVWPDDTE